MDPVLFVSNLVAALGTCVIGGVFFAFSTFVMRALARLPSKQGIEAMQSINRTVLNPWFLGVFLGTAGVCLLLGASTFWTWNRPGAVYLLAGSLLYLIGTFLVTVVFNVPMNDALERVEPASDGASRTWDSYVARWTTWNHVRTIAAVLAATCLVISMCV